MKQLVITDEEKKEVLGLLGKSKLMSVGTYYKDPWAASVYYLFDNDFNLYFVSNPLTIHCRNIYKNKKVSVTIADSSQNPKGNKIGLQASGIAKQVSSAKELKSIIKSWNKRGFVPVTFKLFKKVWKSKFFKIKLNRIQIFDENMPGDREVRNWKL